LSVAVNAKDKLDGSNTQAADLTGASSIAEGNNDIEGTFSASDFVSDMRVDVTSNGTVVATVVITIADTNSIIVISGFVAMGNTSNSSSDTTFSIKRGATVLGTFVATHTSTEAGVGSGRVVDTGQSGSVTYTLEQTARTGTGGIIPQNTNDNSGGILHVTEVTLTDTHAAVLTGQDTHNTKESGVSVN